MTKTIKRIAILLTLVMLAVSVQLPMVMATEANVGIMKYYVDGTQVLALPELTAGKVVKSQIKAADGDILVSAVYNGTVMQIADVGEVIPSQDGKVYETEITIPAGYDEATWDYKNFIWKDASGSMTPATEKTEAFVLSASGTINTVTLAWDVVDGYINEKVDVYRNDSVIATVDEGIGGYIDQVEAGTYTYKVVGKSGRESNEVSATAINVFDHIDALGGVYIQAGLAEDGVTPADISNTINGTPGISVDVADYEYCDNAVKSVEGKKGQPAAAQTGSYYVTGYYGSDDGIGLRVKGEMWDSSIEKYSKIADPANPLESEKNNLTPKKITATDGVSASFFSTGYVRFHNSEGWSSNRGSRLNMFVNDGTLDTNKVTMFIEYWGERTSNFSIFTSNSKDSGSYRTSPASVDKIASKKWETVRIDLTDFVNVLTKNNWANGLHNIAINADSDLHIRRVAVVPTDKLSTYGKDWGAAGGGNAWIAHVNEDAGHFGIATDAFRENEIAKNDGGTVLDFANMTSIFDNYYKEGSQWVGEDGLQINTIGFKADGSAAGGDGHTNIVLNDGTQKGYLQMKTNPTNGKFSKHRYRIDDNYIYGMKDNKVQIEIVYKSVGITNANITYSATGKGSQDEGNANTSILNTVQAIKFIDDGQEHTMTIDLENCNFMSRTTTEKDRDLVIELSDDAALTDGNEVQIYKITVRNANDRLMQDLSL